VARKPTIKGPTPAPIDPVPSIMAVTVAMALLFVIEVPRSAETAVVTRQYGPLTMAPANVCRIILDQRPRLPRVAYKNSDGMASASMTIHVKAGEPVLSARIPAAIDPMIPPMSKGTDMYAEYSADKLEVCLMYMGSQ